MFNLDLPPRWFLDGLKELRTKVRYVGDTHEPTGTWRCELQHIRGGHLTIGEGPCPQAAIDEAKAAIQRGIEDNRWTDTATL